MKKNLIFTLGVMAAATLATTGCGGGRKASAVDENNKVAIRTAVAVEREIPQNVEFTANIEPWQKNYIIPALQGARIRRIYVNVGDKVRKGQLVAEMDRTQYNTVKVQLETAKSDYERIKSVYEAGGVSAQLLQQAEAQYLVSREAFENISRNVELYSPIDGVVTQRPEEEGNLFTSTPILEIMQMNMLKVKVNISEQFYPDVNVGTLAQISVDVYPDESFDGSVCLIYPAIDPNTRTFTAEISIPNADNRLRPGMFARAVINMGDKNAVLIPDVAVQKQSGSNERFIYVVNDGKVERRQVTPGRQVDGMIAIISGLKTGETVATTSFTRLDNGTAVEIINN